MKRILLLAAMLSSVVLAQGETSSKNEATMNISARVIKPLTVEKSGDLDFGTLVQGEFKGARAHFIVTGEPGEQVEVTYDGIQEYDENNNFIVPLSNEGNPEGKKLNANFNITISGVTQQTFVPEGRRVTIGETGSAKLSVAGSMTANVPPGSYSNSFTLKARYQ